MFERQGPRTAEPFTHSYERNSNIFKDPEILKPLVDLDDSTGLPVFHARLRPRSSSLYSLAKPHSPRELYP